jgi:hypothetical protein
MEVPYPKFASVKNWCRISGMSRTGTYYALGRGDLKAIKLRGRTLVDVEAGLTWQRSMPPAQIRPPKPTLPKTIQCAHLARHRSTRTGG